MHVREIIKNNAEECGISMESTWRKHGYLSYNDVVTAISLDTKKCLGVKVLSVKSSNVSSGAKGRMKLNEGRGETRALIGGEYSYIRVLHARRISFEINPNDN